jgi:hypothetical protein
MKMTKVLLAVVAAFALLGSPAFAEDQHPACCLKAKEAGKECTHPCCLEAKENEKMCEKCGGKNADKKDS